MEFQKIVEFLQGHLPMIGQYVLMSLGSLVTLGMCYVAITPSKDDDAWLAKLQEKPFIGPIFKLVLAFSPIVKKDAGGVKLSNVEPAKDDKPS